MLKKKVPKIMLVLTCITAILIQHTSTLLAATLSHSDRTAKLKISIAHEGGDEASGTLTAEQANIYDDNSYIYFVGNTRVNKITEDRNMFADTLYCLDAVKAFPAITSSTYENVGDLNESPEYRGLYSLLNKLYIKTDAPELKDTFLEKAFADSDYDLDEVKAVLTDDDIDVMQQYAIWRFTNSDNEKYNKVDAIRVTNVMDMPVGSTVSPSDAKSFRDIDKDKYSKREDMAKYLYNYLVNSVSDTPEVKYPSIKDKTTGKTTISGGYYKAGPFEITSGNVSSSEYDIKLVDKDGKEITGYNIKLADGTLSTKKINQIFDTPFYIEIPTSTELTSIKLTLEYNKYETKATRWNPEDEEYQPVVLITKEKTKQQEEKVFNIVGKGSYNIELIKQDKESKNKLNNAEFSVQIGDGEAKTYTTNASGILTVPQTLITEAGTDAIKITETKAPAGYKKIDGTLELELVKTENEDRFVASELKIKKALTNATATLNEGKITVTVENEKVTGKYNLELIKLDSESKEKLSGAEFSVQMGTEPAKTYTTNADGILAIPEVAITGTGEDIIKITEIKAPTGYNKIGGTLELKVTKIQTESNYVVSKVDTTKELKNATVNLADGKITVAVENEKIKEITGTYNLELIKQDKDTKAKLSNVEFSVQIGDGEARTYTTNADGILAIPEVTITGAGTDTIKITETKPADGYKAIEGTLELEVTKVEQDGKYIANKLETKTRLANTTSIIEDGKITVTVENEKVDEKVGTYKLQLIKRDKLVDMNLEGADFNIQIGKNEPKIYTTDERGIIELPEIELTKIGTDKIRIEEINAPYGYLATPGVLEITVTKVKSGDKYIVSKVETKKSTIELDAEVYLEDGVVVAIVRNKKVDAPTPDNPEDTAKGKYEVEIVKLNQFSEVITSSPANFNVNGKVYSTQNGVAKVGEVEINKANSKVVDKYFITEPQSPKGHTKFDGKLEVEVYKEFSDDETTYKATRATLKVTDKDGNVIERGDKVQIVTKDGVTKIVINVVNYEMVDLSLRKFITSVKTKGDVVTTQTEREPKVDLEVLDNGESTTAKYNHSKEAIIVRKQDTIIYTLRVYNEGRINAYASQVVDYLPEGLEFVADSEVNKIWNYDEETRKLTTNENYEAKLLLGHEAGKELDCQDLKVECKVKSDVAEDTNIVNIAEITEYKYEDGTLAEDRDSHSDNLNYPKDLPKYDGGRDTDKNDEYVPGQEDDDDFERIFVKSIKGKYELDIVKTDKAGNTISDLIAKFDINGSEKGTENGIIKFENVEINKTNVEKTDKYVIKETQAPDDYSKFDGTIEVEVSKKLSEDEEYYEVDKVTMKVIDSEGKEESKDIEVINEDGTTKIVVKVVNYEKVDLALRKFITAVSKDGEFKEENNLKPSREPKVDLEKLDKGESTTAEYNHSKETVKVEKGDYILYTIRVYNEGKVNAYATKVVDYLPEGLEFVEDAEENKIWDYDEETRKLTTNENYKPELLNAHEEGKELSYQDLQVVCKVKADVKEDTSIVNIAEITEIKDEDKRPAEDRDSTPDNVEPDKYVPENKEDDDDFEKIIVESIKGKYNLSVIKVDKDSKTIKDLVTKFEINEEEKLTKNGIIEIAKVEINKDNVEKEDTYIIKEIDAPKDYKKFDGTIEIKVSKKLSKDEKTYEVDKATIKVLDSEGKEYKGDKIATVEVVNGNVEVKVVNYEKETPKKPEEPKKEEPTPQPEQPQQPQPAPEQPQPTTTTTTKTPATGDILPVVAIGTIGFVLLLNIVQIIISKRKKTN